ncbi:MAG: glucose/galactose MFS transporter [Marinilabiliales bacterium]|nr:glucose/galactose MFS transporter [Marinilabiliales bacterium]
MTKSDTGNKYLFPLIVMASLFFLFGFITTMNNSTIDFLKNAFGLNDVQKQLPNTFFYGAYILSVPVGLMLTKIGYKNGVLLGLALIAIGFFLCIPGVGMGYYGFLSAVSVFAVGVVILQVVAGPYVNAMGSPETAASRLTLTNALNSVATVIAPIFVSLLLVTPKIEAGSHLENSAILQIVKGPFLMIGVVTLAILVVMFFLKLPEIHEEEAAGAEGKSYKSSAFKYTHVWLGSLAIFFYMGVEIGISSFFPDYVTHLKLENISAIDMLKFYWGGLMVGRIIGIFILQRYKAAQILTICAFGGALLLAASFMLGAGSPDLSMWLFLGTGLFHSIMWPVIYNLALEDLGPHSKVASGVIATSVIGAAILTPIMGAIKSATGSVVIAVSCMFVYYAYLIFFAQKGSKIR